MHIYVTLRCFLICKLQMKLKWQININHFPKGLGAESVDSSACLLADLQ